MNTISIFTQNAFVSLMPGKIRRILTMYSPDVVCLQEVKGKKIFALLHSLKYIFCIKSTYSKTASSVRIQTIIASKYPFVKSGEMIIKERKNTGLMPFESKAVYGIIQCNRKKILCYSCHINPFRETLDSRRDKIMQIFLNALEYQIPVVVCGDMNTVIPKKRPYRMAVRIVNKISAPSVWQFGSFARLNEEHYFLEIAKTYGFVDAIGIEKSTFRIPGISVKMKLDWMLYHELQLIKSELTPWVGDHRGVIGTFAV